MSGASSVKKVFNIIKTVLIWIVVAIAAFMMVFTLISVNTFDKNDRSLFGYKFFVVQTDSMSATDFDAGDVIISKAVDITTLQVGDIITFISENPNNYGETVTHKIREVTRDEDGSIAFVTYGTTTDTNDEALATVVIGKYCGRVPNIGSFFIFLKTTPGYIICILLPFLLIIIAQGINCIRLFRKYKKEQLDEVEAERQKLEAEREESRRMMEELMALKQQMAAQGAASASAEQAPKASEEAEAESSAEEKTDSDSAE